MSKVFTLDGSIINYGDWDYQEFYEIQYLNPYTGEGPEPVDWDPQQVEVLVIGNPLPEGAIEEDLDVDFDSRGILRRVSEIPAAEISYTVENYRKELSELTLDIQLGLATEASIERAKTIRSFILENS